MNEADTNTPTNAGIQVMLVDDNAVDRMACKRLLSSMKIADDLICFADAETALQSMENGDCGDAKIILLDVNMPRMNGLEFLEAVQSSKDIQFSGAVAVMISVHLTKSLRDSFEQMPSVRAFVRKPLTAEDLFAAGITLPPTQ